MDRSRHSDPAAGFARTVLRVFLDPPRQARFRLRLVAGLWSIAVLAELVAFVTGASLQRRLALRVLLGLALGLTPLRWLLLALPPTAPGAGGRTARPRRHVCRGPPRRGPTGPATRAGRRAPQRAGVYSGLCFGLGIVLGTAAAGPLYAAVGGSGSFLVAAGFSAVVAVAWFTVAPRQRSGEGRANS